MKNLFDLTGKGAVIIGGAGGIGQAIAQGFAEAGARVVISSRKEKALRRAKQEILEASGVSVRCIACDASDEAEVEALLRDSTAAPEQIDILVNAQGFNQKYPGTEFPADVWDKMFDTNVKSLMLTCKHFGKYMKERGIHGKIINLSSVRGVRAVGNGGMGNVGYCATKGAVDMLTRAYASDLRPHIQVNAIGPTITYTPMMVGLLPDKEEDRAKIASAMPAMRIGMPEDCVGPAVFLASAASDFVTGQIIYPDGGLTAVG
ncbi:MAG: SDR family oxidoreductase [Clostridiales Family XIII bacterium]|jgi:gluconate 5-dehydrogenase|nr:SDR family oxidoreductase [Clostridiales Family XIII bacterium]